MGRRKDSGRATWSETGRSAARVLSLGVVALVAACDGLLEVDMPGDLPSDALEDPAMAPILVNSVRADFECAYGSFASYSGLYTDEWDSSSSIGPSIEKVDRRLAGVADDGTAPCPTSPTAQTTTYYRPMQTARGQAETAFRILSGHSESLVPGKKRLLATVATYGAYAYTMLGEGFCEMSIGEGPILHRPEVLAIAEQRFTTAIDLATQAGAEEIVTWASAGRARVRVGLGNHAGALADARRVPIGFLKTAEYEDNPPRRQNAVYNANMVARHHTLGTTFRDLTVEGVPDTRLQAIDTGVFGFDGLTPLIRTNRFSSPASPIPLASWQEAKLIIAEIEGGQTAVDAINEIRDASGLPRFASTDPAEIRAEVLEERRRVLFGQGQRIADLVRFPELEFQSGLSPKGAAYNDENTCLPLPNVERESNPNID